MPITDQDLAKLCLQIYPEHFSHVWDHFNDGQQEDHVCWGMIRREGAVILVFRGTATIGDWLRNFQAWVDPLHHDAIGPVHAGFYSGVRTVQRELKDLAPSDPLVICGHSLGAARAVILSALLTVDGRPPIARICFGEPKPGFNQLAGILAPIKQQRSYRNQGASGHDEVTDVPFTLLPVFRYDHPTKLTDLPVVPVQHTLGFFRFHVPELYADAAPPTVIL